MKIQRIEVKNFKAINHTALDLSGFTVLVGENGSGKSSVLQAMHWMFQSGRNPAVSASTSNTVGSTLSERDATYMPSPEYKNSGHGQEYGNFKDAPQLDLKVVAQSEDGATVTADMWIKAARNEGLSVHIPSNNNFVAALRNRNKEFSSYIPGLAGIPLMEEKRSKLIVHRLAAAGDANTVLRNVLLLLKSLEKDGKTGLALVEELVSQVLGKIKIVVDFDEDKNQTISASFQTAAMLAADARRTKPLELAGIGFLQVIQIFSYLVYFRPVILLVDEPDAHLHPTAQEKLVVALAAAAKEYNTQVVLSTHSPSIVRSLPSDATVVWMKNGAVQPDGDTVGRSMMGWGLLDKRILLMTEDKKTGLIRSLLSQWPELERKVAIWPMKGSGKLLDPAACASLRAVLGDDIKMVIHRDRDFMMPAEADAFTAPYADLGVHVWLTAWSDIESYWCSEAVIQAHFGLSQEQANEFLVETVELCTELNADVTTRNTKRMDIRNKIAECKNGRIGAYNDAEVVEHYSEHGLQHKILGKTLKDKIVGQAQVKGFPNYHSFGKGIPEGLDAVLASDLHDVLEQASSA